MMAKFILFFLVMNLSMLALSAQNDATTKYEKVNQLFDVLDMEEQCLKAAHVSADQTISNSPVLSGRKKEVLEFFIKYMGYPACKKDLLKLYSENYTLRELDDLITFYKTSAGKKQSSVGVSIQSESMALVTKSLQLHQGELARLAGIQVPDKSKDSVRKE